MKVDFSKQNRYRWITVLQIAAFVFAMLPVWRSAAAQVDQGTVTGTVEDGTGAVIPNATVILKNTDTNLSLQTQADAAGIYNFPPVKIGNYTITASAPGFNTTVQSHVHLDVQERLNVVVKLAPGAVTETVNVDTAPPLLQTQQSSIGQVVSTEAINSTPLNGRNWVYIAQLTSGVAPGNGSRGQGTGDFVANGQRSEQNNFVLDGIDNNVNVIDFMNGTSYVVRPPPDALAEFKIATNSYSAEFGHSAGAVVNASIKSGTNQIHGDLWEYFRNDALDARDFNAVSNPEYRENQFGATIGLPIWRNKLFFFADGEGNRIVQGKPTTLSVPTPLMRQGNFTEILNTSLTGSAKPIQLYQPNSGGTQPLSCGGVNNVFCLDQINSIAQNILNLYPLPNVNNGKTVNNYTFNLKTHSNTWQWDTRMDWNPSVHDQAYARFSYLHVLAGLAPPLGLPLDGTTSFSNSFYQRSLGESFMASETHIFTPHSANEFRFGYTYGDYAFLQPNYDKNLSADFGLGGTPPVTGDGYSYNGGLPHGTVSGITAWGSASYDPSVEHQNVYQILDNATMIRGNHSLKFGVSFQSIRFATLQSPGDPRGGYSFTGAYTSNLSASFTGYGVADFLADQMYSSDLSTEFNADDSRWYKSAYAQDDWRVTSKLTLNLGVRYDYFQPYKEVGGRQANFLPTGTPGPGTDTAILQLPKQSQAAYPLSPVFQQAMVKDHVTAQYLSNPSLVTGQFINFAPRVGFAFSPDSKLAIHGGFGLFYGGMQSQGGATLSYNYPFQFTDNFPAPSCSPGNCPSNGITLDQGYATQLGQGLGNSISFAGMSGSAPHAKTPYTEDYNLEIERSINSNMVASVAYVGDVSRHLQSYTNYNTSPVLLNPANSTQSVLPFPDFGGGDFVNFNGVSSYNSLQTKLEKRLAHGLEFLATYTWSHSLDDAPPLLDNSGTSYRNPNLIPIGEDYANSPFDVRHRVTFRGSYQLPFGRGRMYLHDSRVADLVAGGWATSLTFAAQSGQPITVKPDITTAAGGTARAIRIRDPFAPGGSADPSNPGVICAQHTRTLTNWYNPCAFANPLPGANIPRTGAGSQVTGTAQAIMYLGGAPYQVTSPGYNQVSMSIFKNFTTFREEHLQFRADIFNVLNTPDYGIPSVLTNSSNGGQITASRTIQNFTPDARFFQLSLKYIF